MYETMESSTYYSPQIVNSLEDWSLVATENGVGDKRGQWADCVTVYAYKFNTSQWESSQDSRL